ncbi:MULTISPECIES: zinc-dependent peptidase [unclassified Psychrobacter]|uniref:M90 family metallopeptidase n=1 Tax=unclassified Psychrobacter TaxID=196806 RepID=UPI00071E95C9|nr:MULTISPECIES: M90 family metallopeptidase [unclassified Psychrobacter]OLF38489.1 Mlc titration factor A [Psychrobacter sp. Cmf 22.2]
MFEIIKDWREQRVLDNSDFTTEDWMRAAKRIVILDRLSKEDLTRLFDLATLFLDDKSIIGAQGFEVTDKVRLSIALQACLPILNLGLEWYKGWSSVIIYNGSYKSDNTTTDEFGIVHEGQQHRSGEAWQRGPVVLSWKDAKHSGERDGHNVVIHEFVHKIDMLNGRANGFPPMQPDMDPTRWTKIMSRDFEDFQKHRKSGLDRYGATNPAEFFAVLSEVFFETPQKLIDAYPDIYDIMVKFFRQTPM